MIVVTGAAGRLGQLVIGGLLQRVPAAQIIAAVRTPEKAAPAAVAVLTGEGHENKTYELGGDVAWSYAELAEVLSKATGQEITYRAVSPAEHGELLVAAGIPRIAADLFTDTYAGIADGQLADATGQLSAVIGRPTTSLAAAVAAILDS